MQLTFGQEGDGGSFGGIGLDTVGGCSLIDDEPFSGNWWTCIGCLCMFGVNFPGPQPTTVKKVEIYLGASKLEYIVEFNIIASEKKTIESVLY